MIIHGKATANGKEPVTFHVKVEVSIIAIFVHVDKSKWNSEQNGPLKENRRFLRDIDYLLETAGVVRRHPIVLKNYKYGS